MVTLVCDQMRTFPMRTISACEFEKKAVLSKRLAEVFEKDVLQVACPNGELLLEGSENFNIYKSQYK